VPAKREKKTGHSYGAVNPVPGCEKYQDGVDLALCALPAYARRECNDADHLA